MNAHLNPIFASILDSFAAPTPARRVYVVEVSIIDDWKHPHDPSCESGEEIVRVLARTEAAAIEAATAQWDDIDNRYRIGDATVCEERPATAGYDVEADETFLAESS